MKRIGAIVLATGLLIVGCGKNGEVQSPPTEQIQQDSAALQISDNNSYVKELKLNEENVINNNKLMVGVKFDDNDGFDKINVSYNGKAFTVTDCYAYVLNAYNVNKNGKDFLYMHTIGDSDYNTLIVVDLNGDTIKESGRLDGSGFTGTWSKDYMDFKEDFTSTEGFMLETRIDRLSTMTGVCSYNVDENTGMPVMQQPYYTVKGDFVLTSKIDLEVSILPDNKKEMVPKGTRFKILRTDNKSFVEFMMNDGRECRVEVGKADWKTTIGGKAEDDVFEGMMYAG